MKSHIDSKQLRAFIRQFAAIFAGMEVEYGKDSSGQKYNKTVPIYYGAPDKLVASLYSGGTNNKPIEIPAMTFNLTAIELAPDRRHGIGTINSRPFLPQGAIFPDEVEVMTRVMPVPYNLMMDLTIIASNTDQLHQILEPILLAFDPTIQIQTNDKEWDWTKLTTVELMSISNEENVPLGQDRRLIQWTLSFQMPIWISAVGSVSKQAFIKRVIMNIYNTEQQFINNDPIDEVIVDYKDL